LGRNRAAVERFAAAFFPFEMDGYIILVGMMGSGKTTVGRMLAADLGWSFTDTDQLLQNRLGRPTHQLFEIYGETAFRAHETKILEALQPQSGILATGGGIVLKDENWIQLRRLGTTVFMNATLEVLTERLATAKKRRPLLEFPDWEERVRSIRETRLPLYEKADITVEIASDEFPVVVAKIREAIGL
jgi:shikimate kinase